MKKPKINLVAILKTVVAFSILGAYWYWVNQRIISDTGQAFSLAGFFVLMSLATAYFPLPGNLIVLGAVKTATPGMVALIGGFATLVAYLSEYLIFTVLFKFNKVAGFKNSWVYQQAAPLFDRHRFLILTVASFLPIPSEPLRIYAITRKYSRVLYMLSGFFGRIPRYFLLGYYGKDYVNSVWFLAAVFIFPAFLLVILKGGMKLATRVRSRTRPEPAE